MHYRVLKTHDGQTKTDKQQKCGQRFCQDFWVKIYADDGGIYNLGQNQMAPIFTKTERHYLCWSVFCGEIELILKKEKRDYTMGIEIMINFKSCA